MTSENPHALGPVLRLFQFLSILVGYPLLLLRGRRAAWKPLELSVLEALRACLDVGSAAVLDSQLQEINHIQRVTARRTECNLFKLVPFRVEFHRSSVFEPALAEERLATLHFETGSGLRQVVSFHAVSGRLFSLEFGGDVRGHMNEQLTCVLKFSSASRAAA